MSNTEIIDAADALTEKLDATESEELSPELKLSLSRLQSAILNITSTARERNAINCSIHELILGTNSVQNNQDFDTHLVKLLVDSGVDDVRALKEKFSTSTSPKRLLWFEGIKVRISGLGPQGHRILCRNLVKQGFIDENCVWLK